MERCPELVELEQFFGSAYKSATNGDTHWFYDQLTFRARCPSGEVRCVIEPALRTFAVQLFRPGEPVIDLALNGVSALDLEPSAGQFVLVGHVAPGKLDQLFKLRLKPDFSFTLTTALPSEM